MSMANLVIRDLVDGQVVELPCGLRTLFVAPKTEGAKWDLFYSVSGAGSYNIAVPFSYDYPQPLRSPKLDPLHIIAHGDIHLIYTT